MRHSYRKGLQSALLNWRLVGLVFVISLCGALAFMACAWVWLASVLDQSLATRTLATSLDVNVLIDVAAHHGNALATFGLLCAVLGISGSFVWIGVNGVILATVSGRLESLADAGHFGLARYTLFAKLWIAAMLAHALAIGTAYIGGRWLADVAADSHEELTYYAIVSACFLFGLLAMLMVATIHDHARIRCLDTGDGAWRSGLWASSYVLRERRALTLALSFAGTALAGWAIYQFAGSFVSADSPFGLTISLIWAQMFMAFRALLRVWVFAAATELQSGWERS
jgi:hypothetical protein